jgi:hypothetical protein
MRFEGKRTDFCLHKRLPRVDFTLAFSDGDFSSTFRLSQAQPLSNYYQLEAYLSINEHCGVRTGLTRSEFFKLMETKLSQHFPLAVR